MDLSSNPSSAEALLRAAQIELSQSLWNPQAWETVLLLSPHPTQEQIARHELEAARRHYNQFKFSKEIHPYALFAVYFPTSPVLGHLAEELLRDGLVEWSRALLEPAIDLKTPFSICWKTFLNISERNGDGEKQFALLKRSIEAAGLDTPHSGILWRTFLEQQLTRVSKTEDREVAVHKAAEDYRRALALPLDSLEDIWFDYQRWGKRFSESCWIDSHLRLRFAESLRERDETSKSNSAQFHCSVPSHFGSSQRWLEYHSALLFRCSERKDRWLFSLFQSSFLFARDEWSHLVYALALCDAGDVEGAVLACERGSEWMKPESPKHLVALRRWIQNDPTLVEMDSETLSCSTGKEPTVSFAHKMANRRRFASKRRDESSSSNLDKDARRLQTTLRRMLGKMDVTVAEEWIRFEQRELQSDSSALARIGTKLVNATAVKINRQKHSSSASWTSVGRAVERAADLHFANRQPVKGFLVLERSLNAVRTNAFAAPFGVEQTLLHKLLRERTHRDGWGSDIVERTTASSLYDPRHYARALEWVTGQSFRETEETEVLRFLAGTTHDGSLVSSQTNTKISDTIDAERIVLTTPSIFQNYQLHKPSLGSCGWTPVSQMPANPNPPRLFDDQSRDSLCAPSRFKPDLPLILNQATRKQLERESLVRKQEELHQPVNPSDREIPIDSQEGLPSFLQHLIRVLLPLGRPLHPRAPIHHRLLIHELAKSY